MLTVATNPVEMTLEEFISQAVHDVEIFAAAYRRAMEEGDEGFKPNRSAVDWWREVAAYHEYVEVDEELSRDRRQTPERRSYPRTGRAG